VTTYRVAEAAELLGVSDDTLRRWIDAGRLAARTVDGRSRVQGSDLAALAESLADQPDREATRAAAVSARNRMTGVIVEVKRDGIMAQIDLACGPFRIVSLMSREAADELDLQPGQTATAVVKSPMVIIERA